MLVGQVGNYHLPHLASTSFSQVPGHLDETGKSNEIGSHNIYNS